MKRFEEQLDYLNSEVKKDLRKAGYPPEIVGNLFWTSQTPRYKTLTNILDQEFEEKRVRFQQAIKNRKNLFEIGFNAGHSSLLALSSNDDLIVYANDIAQPFKKWHPEIYVYTAGRVLKELFEDRFHLLIGDSFIEVPKFAQINNIQFDTIHLDSIKRNYYKDFKNVKSLISKEAIVIFDDYDSKVVTATVHQLLKEGEISAIEKFPLQKIQKGLAKGYANAVYKINK